MDVATLEAGEKMLVMTKPGDENAPAWVLRLRALKAERRESSEDLARVAGVRGSTVRRWLRGETEPPATVLQKIADHYGFTLAELMEPIQGERPSSVGGRWDIHGTPEDATPGERTLLRVLAEPEGRAFLVVAASLYLSRSKPDEK